MQSSFYMDGCERFSVSGRCRCCMFCDFCDTRLQPPAQNLCSGAVMMLLDVVPQIDPFGSTTGCTIMEGLLLVESAY